MTAPRNLHSEDLRLRCPGCGKRFATRDSVANHVKATLHGEWITDFSLPDPDAQVDGHPQGGDPVGAPFMTSAVRDSECAQPPQSSDPSHD